MSRSQIHRYIFREVLSPTLLSLLVFTLALLMGRLIKLVDLVINKGVSFRDILVLFGTLVPSFLTISLPLALLMGIMVGLSRMSADNETIALKAAGQSLTNIGLPIFALAVTFSLLTGAAGLWAEPWGYRAFKTKVFEITRQKASIGFRPQIFMDQFENLVFYSDGLDDRTGRFKDLFIVEKNPEGDVLIVADSASMTSDPVQETVSIHLSDGSIHRRGDSGSADSYQIINFRNYVVQPDLDAASTPKTRSRIKPKELSTRELLSRLRGHDYEDKRLVMAAELQRRWSTPLAPLLFALFALPFGIHSQRSGRSAGIIIGLLIYLCYYFLISLAETMAAEGAVPAWVSFWLIHLVLLVAGFYLLRCSSQEKPNQLVNCVNIIMALFKSRKDRRENT
jgi:lipopolysaccharide export system permease protein